MSNKTISINPSLFNKPGSRTKKNREHIKNNIQIISPNVIKNKLLKRIKEHKQKEISHLENSKKKLNNEVLPNDTETSAFSDEFNDSLNYLQTLSKQKKIDTEKEGFETLQQHRKQELERRTLKNYSSIQQPMVNIDLPEELIYQPIINSNDSYKINTPYKGDNLPYGVLKGGLKPTYKEWKQTQKNNIVTNPNSSLIIQGGNLNSEKTARENRLKLLKNKIKNNQDPILTDNLIKKPIVPIQNPLVPIQTTINPIQNTLVPIIVTGENPINPINPIIVTGGNSDSKLVATKHITKKTTTRKYTVGKSLSKGTVCVLIKDNGTKKKVLIAQKELKRKNINDVKTYLRERNIIKTGSNAPNDVLRKLYEYAMLAGEITNSNKDNLLYNFSKENKDI
jgi:hypothetical protein